MELTTQKTITLPDWLNQMETAPAYPSDVDKAQLAVELASLNVKHGTGGPFGAAIFDDSTGNLISMGVNIVVTSQCSVNHAEITAIMMAQEKLQKYRLDLEGKSYVLATSAQPCSMCYGSILWAGLSRIIICATREDVIQLTGFDEGPMPENWVEECHARGVDIIQEVQRNAACLVLKSYGETEGIIY